MAGRHLHVEGLSAAVARDAGGVCGDVMGGFRDHAGSTFLLADGLGHGIRAHVSATLCVARLETLLRAGCSLRQAACRVAATMEEARGTGNPYAAFGIIRILATGEASIIGYDFPGALLVGTRHAAIMPTHPVAEGRVTLLESHGHVAPGEGVMLLSDGIVQAGMGQGLVQGWGLEGVVRAVDCALGEGLPARQLPSHLLAQAERLCAGEPGDDATVLLALCRWGRSLSLLSGPPADARLDRPIVERFLRQDGRKVVCGGSTAQLVARCLGVPLEPFEEACSSLVAPPRQRIEGIDLVTEGAVTLNQVAHLLEVDPARFEEESAVTELVRELRAADRIQITLGRARNADTAHLAFRQQGILPREEIITRLVAQLEAMGKRVLLEAT